MIDFSLSRMGSPTYRILQLSDLHFGSRSFYFTSYSPDEAKVWAKLFADDIEKCLSDTNMRDSGREERGDFQFNLLVLNGDLTCFGQEAGMNAALFFVEEVQQRRWWRAHDIMILPGNHDIIFGDPPPDLDFAKRVVIPVPRAKREQLYREYYRKIALAGVVEGRTSDPKWTGELDTLFMGVLRTDKTAKIAVLGLDSSRIEGWSNPGLGFVGYDQIRSIADYVFEEYESSSETPWRRIAFLHHHVLPMDPVTASAARTLHSNRHFSLSYDADDILEAAEDYKIDFLIHGHYHRPETYPNRNAFPRFGRVLSAGSPSVCGADCNDLHQFFVHQMFDEPDSTDPTFRVSDFRRTLGPATSSSWALFGEHEFPLTQRFQCQYARTPNELTRRTAKANKSRDFLRIYDEYPLAMASLNIPMSSETAKELYERMQAVWDWYRKDSAHLPPMGLIIGELMTYLSQHRQELLAEFNTLLNDRERAFSFEMFLLDIITRDPRYSRTSDVV
jgi:3',5'-cyclic AMP phosphodiesterase CpdA